MGVRRHVVVAMIASMLGLGNVAADPAPDWVVVKISRVQVKPRRIDGSTWDLPGERRPGGCGVVGVIGKATLSPLGGSFLTFLCSGASARQQRDPSAPDLFVQVVAGDARYRTPVALDTFAEAFDFPVVVPLAAIPAAGLEVQVLDQDVVVGVGELIGMVRVTRKQVQDALASGVPLLTMSDSQVERIEIDVAAYSAPPVVNPLRFDVNQEPVAVPARARAGELVTIFASGKYSVAGNFEEIDENGYIGGQKQSFNRRPDFEKDNHGVAVALVGGANASHAALVVGSCITAVAPTAGQIFVGVNDSDVLNNHGSIAFVVGVGLPTVDQWRSGGAFECPHKPRRGDHEPTTTALKDTDDTNLPDGIDRTIISDGIAKVKADVVACGRRSPVRGTVKLAVTVGSDGRVASVAIKAAPDRVLGSCVAAAVQGATFSRTRSGGSFAYPFVF